MQQVERYCGSVNLLNSIGAIITFFVRIFIGKVVKKHVGIRRLMPEDTKNNNGQQVRLPGTGKAASTIQNKAPTLPATTTNANDESIDLDSHPLKDATHFKPLVLKPLPTTPPPDSPVEYEIQLEPNQPELSPFRGVSLKDFEQQRKRIEEQNKQKVSLLQKAIEQHSQKTAQEAKKLEEVRKELNKLDSELAADVAILRKQIEVAAIQFSHVQKHYDNIEQLFLKAKLDLHQAHEKKELLTEHLCTIIAHNEDRKAKKLTELMEKVGLRESNGDSPH